MQLPEQDQEKLDELRPQIRSQLQLFSSTPPDRIPRELVFCLLTPQSNPYHAEACVKELETLGLFSATLTSLEVARVLRVPAQYVRFHNQKAERVVRFIGMIDEVREIATSSSGAFCQRDELVRLVLGFSWKEASHGLRNIGRRGLAILDRHILRNLLRLGIIDAFPTSLSERRYKDIEKRFLKFAEKIGEEIDVLDLFFWGREAGSVFK